MADAVPRTPEEDRPRLTREELEAIADRFKREDCNEFINGRCYTRACFARGGWTSGPTEGFTPTCEAKKVVMACELAQRTVAAQDEAARMAGDEEGHLNKVEQMRMRAEQAERTLADVREWVNNKDGRTFASIVRLVHRRLLQEG